MISMRLVLLCTVLCLFCCERSQAADHGVILLYHHVADDTPAATSVTPQQFALHLDYIADNDFQVVPLNWLLQELLDGRDVPDNAVAISFDDAYRSVFVSAFPLLRARGWPFTVFVASDPIDQQYDDFMTWDQLREMAASGAQFGGHSLAHDYLARRPKGEPLLQWQQSVRKDVRNNMRRIREQLPGVIDAFAYPYGEHTEALRTVLAEAGLRGITQQSGGVDASTNPWVVPRFPMMTTMASLDRLALALHVRPLPVQVIAAGDEVRSQGQAPGSFKLALQQQIETQGRVQCFTATGQPLSMLQTAEELSITLPTMTPGRFKVNCTAATGARAGEYFWYSHQWLVTDHEGQWLEH